MVREPREVRREPHTPERLQSTSRCQIGTYFRNFFRTPPLMRLLPPCRISTALLSSLPSTAAHEAIAAISLSIQCSLSLYDNDAEVEDVGSGRRLHSAQAIAPNQSNWTAIGRPYISIFPPTTFSNGSTQPSYRSCSHPAAGRRTPAHPTSTHRQKSAQSVTVHNRV